MKIAALARTSWGCATFKLGSIAGESSEPSRGGESDNLSPSPKSRIQIGVEKSANLVHWGKVILWRNETVLPSIKGSDEF